ncbi:carboxypeptidase O-like [Leptodactylus fuscus]
MNRVYPGEVRHQVLNIIPETPNHVAYIKEICHNEQKENLLSLHFFLRHQILIDAFSFSVLIDDVQTLVDKQFEPRQKKSLSSFDYTKYHPMNEVYEWMDQIKETHKDLVSIHYLGSTYETRPIYYLKIGLPANKKKKIIWMDCAIHAREWISVAFCQWFIREILQHHSHNPVIHKALENIDFYIVPVLNIDGFIYSWTTERLWRKTRSPHDGGRCYGVDLNRNFDSSWCSIGASTNCSSLTFCGPTPESEPETRAVSQLVSRLKSDILCYLTMHSYGNYVLLPYGYTQDLSANHDEQMSVGQTAGSKIESIHGTRYRVGPASHVLYSNAGNSMDWATDQGISISYTFELRDNGTYGFVLPEDQIQPTCEEATAGVLSIVDYLNEKHFNSASSIFSGTLWINLSFSIVIGTYCSLY